ncbi:MAG TPA: T9SS type A sorting domain-containing protein [Lacibacter sp.]|nr:T9SS type A sorting domain-containing protein [Lacibacter sp.]
MKKIILLFVIMTSLSFYTSVTAQCVVKNVLVKVNSSTPSTTTPGACDVDFDFIFTIENNGGNKYIYMHAWMAGDYPNFFGCPNPNNNSKPPVAADLVNSKINIGIHNDVHAGHPAPTLISTYFPDPTVVLTVAGSLVRSVFPSGDSARFTIKNVKITVPKACTDIINMKADFWSSQAQAAQNAQCVFCNLDFTIDPRVNGLINCVVPHTFNVAITSVAPVSISGYYDVFLDNSSDPLKPGSVGTYGAEDTIKVYTSPFTTQVNGSSNVYNGLNIPYPPYNAQKPEADRNLWVVVTTNQYNNKAINIISNSCNALTLTLVEFKAQVRFGAVLLQWNSENESDMSGFTIERKAAGETFFKEIGFVEAFSSVNTNKGAFAYSFSDVLSSSNEMRMYRLKMIEKNGAFVYSDIRSVRTGNSKLMIFVYPNPNKGLFKIAVPANSGVFDVLINDNSGRLVKQLVNIRNQADVSGMLPSGVYFIKIYFRETGETIIEKVVVL